MVHNADHIPVDTIEMYNDNISSKDLAKSLQLAETSQQLLGDYGSIFFSSSCINGPKLRSVPELFSQPAMRDDEARLRF